MSAEKSLNWTSKVGHLSDDLAEWRGFIRSMNGGCDKNCYYLYLAARRSHERMEVLLGDRLLSQTVFVRKRNCCHIIVPDVLVAGRASPSDLIQ